MPQTILIEPRYTNNIVTYKQHHKSDLLCVCALFFEFACRANVIMRRIPTIRQIFSELHLYSSFSTQHRTVLILQ